jgi:hypothetical protein
MPLPPLHGVGQADECPCPQCQDDQLPAWLEQLLGPAPKAPDGTGTTSLPG